MIPDDLGQDAGVDLLEHLVHIDGITPLPALPPLIPVLLLALGRGFLGALFGCRADLAGSGMIRVNVISSAACRKCVL